MSRSVPEGGLHPEITLPHEQDWELYNNSFSLCSKKVRICLAELGLPYRNQHVHLIETGAYENVRPAFLKVNPAGTVPVLVHEGHPVYESHEQIVYAAEHSIDADCNLLPAEPALRARVAHWSDCASIVGNPLLGTSERAGHCIPGLTLPLFASMMPAIPYREILKGLLTHPNKERPLLFALLKLRGPRGLPGLRPAMRVVHRSRRDMGVHLDDLSREFEAHGKPWIAGDDFTLADVSWMALLDRLVEADWERHFWGEGRRPAVASYWRRLSHRPSYRSQVLDARCANTARGIADLAAEKRSNARLKRALEEAD